MKYKNLLISRYYLISKYIGVIIMFAGGAILSPLLFLTAYPEEAALAPHFLLYRKLCFCRNVDNFVER
ncbi:hypothetical protein C7954_1141 [Halanaerobium congolense]|uniref:Uncharacterized protein n=1 Tax=Halanaerobium congolense TaxID=54121 RepID=A0A4R8GHF8_9FIRM|nr:hypothetical protein [Halanaerobium congolense]TDX43708.1 hypothetical protein C7954_1141 [Halanaerobium congolense]